MVCKIKFNNSVLDELPPMFLSMEEYHQLLVDQLDAIYSYFNAGKAKMPDNLPMATLKVIMGLGEMAGIRGFVHPRNRAGRPGKWSEEHGYILSAHVQLFLFQHKDKTLHYAVTKQAQKLFKDKNTEGVYRRYLEEENKEQSLINIPRLIKEHFIQTHKNDLIPEKMDICIEALKHLINDRYKSLFPKSTHDIFKFADNIQKLYIERIDLEKIFKTVD